MTRVASKFPNRTGHQAINPVGMRSEASQTRMVIMDRIGPVGCLNQVDAQLSLEGVRCS